MTTELVEVRAIVRAQMLDGVIRALRDNGIPRLTVTRVHAIGVGVDAALAKLSVQEGAEYADKALIQFVCGSGQCDHLTGLLARTAWTGRRGDGIVYVMPVHSVTKLRTGATGLAALH